MPNLTMPSTGGQRAFFSPRDPATSVVVNFLRREGVIPLGTAGGMDTIPRHTTNDDDNIEHSRQGRSPLRPGPLTYRAPIASINSKECRRLAKDLSRKRRARKHGAETLAFFAGDSRSIDSVWGISPRFTRILPWNAEPYLTFSSGPRLLANPEQAEAIGRVPSAQPLEARPVHPFSGVRRPDLKGRPSPLPRAAPISHLPVRGPREAPPASDQKSSIMPSMMRSTW